ncbi:RISC-loading complex subunit TARBP2-like [Calliopsis andreniformis]|uniref:RISC-loading complex subunit TARBP2-like n=1 Tax=Calliopsis andreniformis TaxID=337506 RepID=UPI003FCC73AA
MDKTPIMVLHEIAIKNCTSMPVYSEIGSIQGTHQNQFIIGVRWKTYAVKGIGSSKKEAKQNAAKEMLSTLFSAGEITEKSLLSVSSNASVFKNAVNKASSPSVIMNTFNNFLENSFSSTSNSSLASSSCSSPMNSSCSYQNTLSVENKFVNYVGPLLEYCVSKNIPTPLFTVVNVSGQSHAPMFTMNCVLDNICEEATATTKKDAKQKVAKKMLQRLTGSTDVNINKMPQAIDTYVDKLNVELMNLSIDEVEPNNFKVEKALQVYNKISQKPAFTKTDLQVSDYHEALTYLFHNIPLASKVSLMDTYTKRAYESEDIKYLKSNIYDALQTRVEKICFTSNNETHFIIGLKLSIVPQITQIGIGGTVDQAERRAFCKLFELMFLYLAKRNEN